MVDFLLKKNFVVNAIDDLSGGRIQNIKKNLKNNYDIILCGGGRKNKTLVKNLKKLLNNNIINIDSFKIDGDFIESQAFGYLGIRSFLKKNISFPNTTKVKKPISGGELIKAI